MITQKRSENITYAILWAMVLSLPVFTLKGGNEFNWNRVVFEWIRTLPFLLIFVINNSLLAPKLLLRKKHVMYLVSIVSIVFILSAFNHLPRILHRALFQAPVPRERPMKPPRQISPRDLPFHGPMKKKPMNPTPAKPRDKKPLSYLIFENMIISFLVVGFNNAIKLGIKQQKEELLREEKEKMHLETELSFLRQQISPHFFMNTLNNIHALIEMDQVKAQKSVIELSRLMRYLLKESQEGMASIKEEFEFLTSYIDLMSIRYSNKVKIDMDLNLTNDSIKIPSLLFISLVENAFKYGVSYNQESYIYILAFQEEKKLTFEVANSKSDKKNVKSSTGVGLVNLQKQLDLLFGEIHTFDVIETEKEYRVKLIIPLQDD
ncbi:sensor histidine kinase [Marinifilum caeruleilacunae]|uniref:Histidine kinase n=1 Tax=Marinifilum caeruleilacunae TaxID=2499076 RepID=A0ABX1X1G3_9BACT|nr:sensor histidine kinase [Marinifilum caeruleilacunae]NOU61928.1 histidine kinase [Marinifilum caeruleilacunae]